MGRPSETAHNHNKLCVFLQIDDHQIASKSAEIYTQILFQTKYKTSKSFLKRRKAG